MICRSEDDMTHADQKETLLLKDGIASIMKRIYQTAPTMLCADAVDLIRLAYTLGRIVGRDEKEKEILLFKGRDPDEKRRNRKC